MHRHVRVALFETIVLLDMVKIVATNDDGTLHFLLDHHTFQDTPANADGAGERTFLVDVCAFNCNARSFEAKTNVAPETFLTNFDAGAFLGIQEDVGLLLKSTFGLYVRVNRWMGGWLKEKNTN